MHQHCMVMKENPLKTPPPAPPSCAKSQKPPSLTCVQSKTLPNLPTPSLRRCIGAASVLSDQHLSDARNRGGRLSTTAACDALFTSAPAAPNPQHPRSSPWFSQNLTLEPQTPRKILAQEVHAESQKGQLGDRCCQGWSSIVRLRHLQSELRLPPLRQLRTIALKKPSSSGGFGLWR